jgi:hypothetical protein
MIAFAAGRLANVDWPRMSDEPQRSRGVCQFYVETIARSHACDPIRHESHPLGLSFAPAAGEQLGRRQPFITETRALRR